AAVWGDLPHHLALFALRCIGAPGQRVGPGGVVWALPSAHAGGTRRCTPTPRRVAPTPGWSGRRWSRAGRNRGERRAGWHLGGRAVTSGRRCAIPPPWRGPGRRARVRRRRLVRASAAPPLRLRSRLGGRWGH